MNLGNISLKHRNDLNFNLFDHATNELKRGEYEVLSKKEVECTSFNFIYNYELKSLLLSWIKPHIHLFLAHL
jgi:hypothetical protein